MLYTPAVPRILATYHLACPRKQVEAAARWIAVEQTVEVPDALIDAHIEEAIVGRVESIDTLEDGRFAVAISYDAALAGGQLPQLLSLVFGNVSLGNFVRLERLALPAEFLARFRGPNFGVAGLRELVGVPDRPLLATALKPRGKSVAEFAALAGGFARGGGDLVKDDHNLVDARFEDFDERVRRCQAAVEETNAATGGRCLYLPYVCAPADELDRYVAAVRGHGVRGVLVAPMIAGLDTVRALAERERMLVMSHPTFTGAFQHDRNHGLEPGLLLGLLFRLAGIDVSVFVNSGGRFDFTREECGGIATALRAPLGDLPPAWPCPAGGMQFDRVGEMVAQFGPDTVLLVGGALLTHAPDVTDATRAYLDAVREAG